MSSVPRRKQATRRAARRAARPLPWLDRVPAPFRRWLADEFASAGRTLVAPPVLAVLLLAILALLMVYQFPQARRINSISTTIRHLTERATIPDHDTFDLFPEQHREARSAGTTTPPWYTIVLRAPRTRILPRITWKD